MVLVSAVIPAFNCSRYIRDTIGSILHQKDAPDIEVIVINDGSTDDTGHIARQFGTPVRVIDQHNAGVSAARNRGIREAKGDYIALVDHDDFWMPNKLANQIACFESHPNIDVVFTEFCRWCPDPIDGNYPDPTNFEANASRQGIDLEFSGLIYHQMLLDSWILTSTALARSTVVHAAGGFDEALPFSEDWDFWLRVSRDCIFMKLNEQSTLYRQHPKQGSRVVRAIDYRTQLLEEASRKWGLCSRDGRCVPRGRFKRQLAKYSTSFGLNHLKECEGANRAIAVRAFLKAWSIDPFYLRPLVYLTAMSVGWKPEWHTLPP